MYDDVIHRITYLIQYYYIILFIGCQRFRLNFLVEKIEYSKDNINIAFVYSISSVILKIKTHKLLRFLFINLYIYIHTYTYINVIISKYVIFYFYL